MFHIFKSMIVLFLELNIYQFLGYALGQLKFIPEPKTFILKSIYGFLLYHVLFWCISFPCTLLDCSLQLLTILWSVLMLTLLLFIGIFYFKHLLHMYQQAGIAAWHNRLYLIPCLIMGIIVTYYICVNGQIDIDARTYIGEVTSMVDTGRLAGISVTSGMEVQLIQLRRSFSMFGANSAVLCKLFQIHPLVLCRTTRAAINIHFFTSATLELYRQILRHYKNAIAHALMCTTLTLGLLFAFTNTIYTEGRFMLYRAYEGKAYCASTLVLITILVAVKLCSTKDIRYFIIVFLDMLAGMSISASATFILPLAGGCMIAAYAIYHRKWMYFLALLFSLLPNFVYIVLSLRGFAGFYLEG